MKYAKEVIDLMKAYPGRSFRMSQLLRELTRERPLTPSQAESARKGVRRVLNDLVNTGFVERAGGNTNSAAYLWCYYKQSATSGSCVLGQQLGQ